jgi:serine/threonine-protein kinase
MPDTMNGNPAADRNLLFGILALQMDFIDRDALIQAMNAWVLEKSRPLGLILRDQGHLASQRLDLLNALVQEHLAAHHGDPQQSLAALAVPASIHQDLRSLADHDLQGSLNGTPSSHDTDPGATGPYLTGPQVGSNFGLRYRVLRPHAKGGLGEVFVAEDQELHREVALKEIRPHHSHDPQSRKRFLMEAEITGALEHPGIVPVYGLGQYEDGRPYYAMRFIKGDTLKEAIRRFHTADTAGRDPGERALALRKMLGQFVTACNAVAYAHSRGVLNRDIKDDNIMLGKFGETLVIDWGLAKVASRPERDTSAEDTLRPSGEDLATQMGSALGTPAYMSPEAAAGRLDLLGRASDIYSLGATLYKLLTGRSPIQGSGHGEVLRKASRGEWLPPRQVKKDVPAALDAICRKAMALKPEARYETALALAADVEHWLADEPVAVYREPVSARLRRWSRRHRAVVSAAMALLLTAVVGLALGLVVVNQERQRTEVARSNEARRRQQARQALDAMSSTLIDEWLGKQKELLPEHRVFLEQALRFYEEFAQETGQDEEARAGVAAASYRVGFIYKKLGQMAPAEAGYRRSAELYRLLTAEFPDQSDYRLELARTHNGLGIVLQDTGRQQEAETAYRDAIMLEQQLAVEFPNRPNYRLELAKTTHNLGNALLDTGRHKEAETSYRDALKLYQQLAADFPEQPDYRNYMASCHCVLGMLLGDTGRPQEAETAYREALTLQQRLAADFPNPDYRNALAYSHVNLGRHLQSTGRPQGAETNYREALRLYKQLTADFPNRPNYRLDLALCHHNLGNLLADAGRPQEAETAYRDALRLRKQLAADFPNQPLCRYELASSHQVLGNLLADTGRPQDAETAYRDALRLRKQLAAEFPNRPEYRSDLASSHENLGILLMTTGRQQEAETAYREALRLHKQLAAEFPDLPYYRSELAGGHHNLGILFKDTGRLQEAETAYRDALRLYKQLAAEFPTVTGHQASLANALDSLAELNKDQRHYTEACQLVDEALPLIQTALRVYPLNQFYREIASENRHLLAQARLGQGEYAAAVTAAEEMLRVGFKPVTNAYNAACLVARCVRLVIEDQKLPETKRRELAQSYADRAVVLLRQSVAKGFKNLAQMKADKDLDPLRSHKDFQALLAELAKAAPPDKQTKEKK